MNIKTFIEESEREFAENWHAIEGPNGMCACGTENGKCKDRLLTMHSSKLRELIGEVRNHLKGRIGFLRQWINEKPTDVLVTNEDIIRWLELELLDEAGGGK